MLALVQKLRNGEGHSYGCGDGYHSQQDEPGIHAVAKGRLVSQDFAYRGGRVLYADGLINAHPQNRQS